MPTLASLSELLAGLPPPGEDEPSTPPQKIVVLDDDPTGTQTVYGIPVLSRWDVQTLTAELRGSEPACYLLTNSRALPEAKAVALYREIGDNLAAAGRRAGVEFTVVSRSDSTLRGHYPAETDALAAGLGEPLAHAPWILVPAFFAGGRLTVHDIHYVQTPEGLLPVGDTEYARDASFGYRSSHLGDWVTEKTKGRIPASHVHFISLEELRSGNLGMLARRLVGVPTGHVVVVNAAARGDLVAFASAWRLAHFAGHRFLFRGAADLVAVLAGLRRRDPLPPEEWCDAPGGGGLVVVGSYVTTTTRQLDALLQQTSALDRCEVAVPNLLASTEARAREVDRAVGQIDRSLAGGRDIVVFTSRALQRGSDPEGSLALGRVVSSALVRIVRRVQRRPRWIIAKGGITSNDLATEALGVQRAVVLGQALPGVPVWRLGPESKWPGLPYVVFPGNVGDAGSLARLVLSLPMSTAPAR